MQEAENYLSNSNMERWSIYRHTSPSGKIYIGITSKSPEERWAKGWGYVRCPVFMKAIKKYGWDNIKHEVLFTGLSEERVKQLEINLIRHYKRLGLSYNITDGGDGSLGRFASEETKAKQRARKLGKKLSEEHRAKIRKFVHENLKGVPLSEETKRKLHEANKGKKPSPQTIAALKEYLKTRVVSQESIIKMVETQRLKGYKNSIAVLDRNREQIGIKHRKPVVQFDLAGNYIKRYDAVKFAAAEAHIDVSPIISCCKNRACTAAGSMWMYEEDYNTYLSQNKLEERLQEMIERASQKSYVRTEEWRAKARARMIGKCYLPEKDRNRLGQYSKEHMSIPVMQMSMNEQPLNVFTSSSEVKSQLGFDNSYINKCCKNIKPHAYGFKWKYISKEEYNAFKTQNAA